jgi:hypothetical protein
MPTNNGLYNSDVSTLINFFENLSGFQRSNRYRISITPPKPPSGSGVRLDPTVLYATNVQIPEQVVLYYPDTMSPSGPNINIPVKRTYDNRFIMDFIVDKYWRSRDFFEGWMSLMFKDTKNASKPNSAFVNYFDKVTGTFDIYALDVNDNVNKHITLYDAYPSTILPTQMMAEMQNDYLLLTVDVNYRYYTIKDT